MKIKQKHHTPPLQQSPWIKTMTWATIAAQIAIPLSAAFTPAMLFAATENPGQHSENTLNSANAATHLAKIIGSDNAAKEAGSMLLNSTTSVTSSTAQNWLNQFGTARVELNLQNDFSLDGSQFDLLLPLHQTQTLLTFGQVGIRYIDDQTTANLGLGQRHFADQWMLGYNLFLDHNLSRSHTRLGIGTEYHRDYFKLAANGYIALSNWKNSRNLQGYDEKPADGFDILTETYLPFLPQLGAKLMYEQYFGKDVGLFGKDNRQQNPYAVTLGLNYTPIPLITAGVDHQAGRGGLSDTCFNLGVNYILGVPWSEQTNPDAMVLKHTLGGSRYDLVERNNQIILQYREQKQVTLSLADRLEGTDGQSLSLQVKATAQRGVSQIKWNTAAFIAAGGQLINTGNDWQVVLPHYLPNSNNTYHISGIAYDALGNASPEAHSQITVTGYGINASYSSLSAEQDQLPADGKANTLIELTLLNDQQQPVTGAGENIAFTTEFIAASTSTHNTGQATEIPEPVPHHLSEVTESPDQPGHYQAILTAGSIPGTVRIATLINGKPQADLSATIQLTTEQVTLSLADQLEGTDSQSLSLQVKATAQQGVSDIKWNTTVFIAAGGQLINTGNDWQVVLPHYLPNGNNTYHISGIAYDALGNASPEAHSQITVTGYGINTSYSSLSAEQDQLPADGKTNTLIELTLLNDQQQPVTGVGENIAFTTEFIATSTSTHNTGQATEIPEPVPHHLSEVTESPDQPGHYQAIFTSGSIPGTVRIATLINGKPQTDLSTTIQLTADKTTATGGLTLASTEPVSVGQNNSVTATILDAYHHPLPDYTVTFVGVPGRDQSLQTNESGVATLTFSSTEAGEYPISITVGEDTQHVTARFIDPVAISQISVNNQRFAANSGFPTHAFAGATFDILINNDTKGYTWKSDSDAVSVSDKGTVTINQEPGKGKEVTISIESKLNPDEKTHFKFNVEHWWKLADTSATFQANLCSKAFGEEYKIPHYQDMTTATNEQETGQRAVGTLYGEWGDMSAYHWHINPDDNEYWVRNAYGEHYYLVYLDSGKIHYSYPYFQRRYACIK